MNYPDNFIYEYFDNMDEEVIKYIRENFDIILEAAPEINRELFVEHYKKNVPIKEIAKSHGMAVTTVKEKFRIVCRLFRECAISLDVNESLLYLGLPNHTVSSLYRGNIRTVSDLCSCTREQVAVCRNIGKSSMAIIEDCLKERGLYFKVKRKLI